MSRIFNGLKQHRLGSLAIGLLFCSACAKPIMPPLQYTKPIDVHSRKNAYLHWEVGKQYSSEMQSGDCSSSGGGVGGLLATIVVAQVDSAMRARQPSRYQYTYGKAEQSIFMTSLKDILEKNQVFKKVELITDRNQAAAKDVLINIYFKTCRVLSPERGYAIVLNVDVTIFSGGKSLFKRTYLVKSGEEGGAFVDRQAAVSQQLLNKVIAGIEEWHKQSKF